MNTNYITSNTASLRVNKFLFVIHHQEKVFYYRLKLETMTHSMTWDWSSILSSYQELFYNEYNYNVLLTKIVDHPTLPRPHIPPGCCCFCWQKNFDILIKLISTSKISNKIVWGVLQTDPNKTRIWCKRIRIYTHVFFRIELVGTIAFYKVDKLVDSFLLQYRPSFYKTQRFRAASGHAYNNILIPKILIERWWWVLVWGSDTSYIVIYTEIGNFEFSSSH